jgi:hypothetical protein
VTLAFWNIWTMTKALQHFGKLCSCHLEYVRLAVLNTDLALGSVSKVKP